jgi:hypothetical protein
MHPTADTPALIFPQRCRALCRLLKRPTSRSYGLNEIAIGFIISDMSEEATQNLPDGRSFEERVFARFDAMEALLRDMDARIQRLEARAYDTKPIWEQALKEIVDTRRELSKRLDRIEAVAHETRADLRDAEDRIERIEPKPVQ